MKYTITAHLEQTNKIVLKNKNRLIDSDKEQYDRLHDNSKNEESRDYVTVTLQWGKDKNSTARTNRQKFREIVKTCSRLFLDDHIGEDTLKAAGQSIAELLLGESYGEESPDNQGSDSLMDYYTMHRKPLEVLQERLPPQQDSLDHIMIVCEDPTLEELPWELLVINDEFICLSQNIRLFRLHEAQEDSRHRQGPIDLRIRNVNMSKTRLAKGRRQYDKIRAVDPPAEYVLPTPSEFLERTSNGGNITALNVQDILRTYAPCTVFHFAGHGDLIDDDKPGLCVSDGTQLPGMSEYQTTLIEPHHLATFLGANDNRLLSRTELVVCACCQSGIGKNSSGFGTSLIELNAATAVIGMQAAIRDRSVNCFTDALYERLPEEVDVVSAVTEARRRVSQLSNLKNRLEWWIPTLHSTRIDLYFQHRGNKSSEQQDVDSLQGKGRSLREKGADKELLEVFGELAASQPVDDADSLKYLNTISVAYRDMGDLQESLQRDYELLEHQRRMLGVDDPATVETRRRMAITLRELGMEEHLSQALELELEVLASQERLLDVADTELLRTRNHIATLHKMLGQWKKALDVEEVLLEDRKRILPEGHRDILASHGNIAELLRKRCRYIDSLEMERELLEDRKRFLRDDHPDILTSRNNVAESLWTVGKYQESLDMEQELLKDREEILPPDHPDILKSRNSIAVSLWEVGKYRESLSLEEEVLEIRNEKLGPDHRETLKTLGNLAESLRNFGSLDEALSKQQRVIKSRKKVYGETHQDTLLARDEKAVTLRALGRFDEALKLHKSVSKIRAQNREKLADDDAFDDLEHLFIYRDEMAITLRELGRFEEALEIHKEVLEGREGFLPPEHPHSLDTPHQIAIVLRELGKLDEALESHNEVLVGRERLLGIDHPKTLLTQHEMAITLRKQGELSRALEIHMDVLERQARVLGEDHPDALSTRQQMSIVLAKLGKLTDANRVLEDRDTEEEP